MVVIKDFEMPKYCNDCDFVADSLGYCERAKEHIPNYDFFSDENEKPSWCPLIEIEQFEDDKIVSLGAHLQVVWERDLAIEQLKQLGYGLGEKIRTCKDCKHKEEDNQMYCPWLCTQIEADFYCKDWERSEE